MHEARRQRPGGGVVPIGRLAGIPIGIQPLWLVIVGLITWSLGTGYYPDVVPGIGTGAAYGLGLLSALLLFAGIIAHELGHAVVARRNGVGIERINLWLLGGVARMRNEPTSPGAELRFALAGPAVTAVIVAVFAIVRVAMGDGGAAWLRAVVSYQLYVNAAILGFNLLPAFPLDGGRVLRALLWRHSGDHVRATGQAATIGRAFGWLFVALAVAGLVAGLPSGIWLALVGGFLILAARAEAQHLRVTDALGDRSVADVMTAPALILPADEVADLDPALVTTPAERVADVFIRPAFQRIGRAVVVGPAGEVLGVLSLTDVNRLLDAADRGRRRA